MTINTTSFGWVEDVPCGADSPLPAEKQRRRIVQTDFQMLLTTFSY
jgi:hypothetical protein